MKEVNIKSRSNSDKNSHRKTDDRKHISTKMHQSTLKNVDHVAKLPKLSPCRCNMTALEHICRYQFSSTPGKRAKFYGADGTL